MGEGVKPLHPKTGPFHSAPVPPSPAARDYRESGLVSRPKVDNPHQIPQEQAALIESGFSNGANPVDCVMQGGPPTTSTRFLLI